MCYFGTKVVCVKDGHTVLDPVTNQTLTVSEGNMVAARDGRTLYCVESDHKRITDKLEGDL